MMVEIDRPAMNEEEQESRSRAESHEESNGGSRRSVIADFARSSSNSNV